MKVSSALAFVPFLNTSSAYLPIPRRDVNANQNPPARKDITTMGTEEYNLFILAFAQWQRSGTGDVGGFYQVAGIHGAPYQYWDNSPSNQPPSRGGGYCFHGTNPFYLWHRPYVALFEQQIQAIAVNISNSWTTSTRSTYQAAAANLRFPYWDWARNGGTIPSQLTNSQVSITNKNGQKVTVANPLYSHTLVSGANLGTAVCPGGSQTRTCRSGNAQSDMQSSGSSLQQNTALLLNTRNICWNNFATYDSNERRASGCSSTSIQSLEGIHNTVHNNICGTMCSLDTAAYDPIFWLHHTNVDRIGALWEYLNPNVKVQSTRLSSGNYVQASGITGDGNTPLYPFRGTNSSNDWWRPNQLYGTRELAYTYPEIADLPSNVTLQNRVNALYGNGRTQQSVSTSSKKAKRGDELAGILEARQAAASLSDPPSTEALEPYKNALITRNGSFSEYTADCTIRRSVAPGISFNLHLFFGDVPTTLSNSDYLKLPNRVGGFSIAQSSQSSGANDATGIVPITDALLNTLIAGGIKDLKPRTVRQFVSAQLIWRIVTVDGRNIGETGAKDSGLTIHVDRTVVTPEGPVAAPVVAAPNEVAPPSDVSENVTASPVPSGVAGTTTETAAPTSTSTTSSVDAAVTTGA